MEKIYNVVSVEYGTITVDVPKNLSDEEAEAKAWKIFGEGNTDWGDQETYLDENENKLPQLVFSSDVVYQLFDCDEHRSYSSMKVSSPIAVSLNVLDFAEMLIKDLENAAKLSDNNEEYFKKLMDKNLLPLEILNWYENQLIDYRNVIKINLGFNNN